MLCTLYLEIDFGSYITCIHISKVPKGNPYHSATSGEMAIYRANSLILRKVYTPVKMKSSYKISVSSEK